MHSFLLHVVTVRVLGSRVLLRAFFLGGVSLCSARMSNNKWTPFCFNSALLTLRQMESESRGYLMFVNQLLYLMMYMRMNIVACKHVDRQRPVNSNSERCFLCGPCGDVISRTVSEESGSGVE
jgi:hypothetical protein